MRWVLAAAFVAISTTDAWAEQFLEQVESPVYEATGDVAALSGRAAICAEQILRSGTGAAPAVLATDPAEGVVIANSHFAYNEIVFGSALALEGRSKVRIEARPGRFRIIHTDIGVFGGEWRRVRMPKEGKRSEMREQLLALSDKLAACVKGGDRPADW